MFILALWFFVLHLFRILQVKFTSQWFKSFLFHTTNCKHLYWRCVFTYTFYVCERWSLKFACFVRWYGPQIWAGTAAAAVSLRVIFPPFFRQENTMFLPKRGCQVVIEYKSNRKKNFFPIFLFLCVYMCLSLKNIGLTPSTTLELSKGFKLYLLLFHYISKTYNDLIKY